MRAGNSLKRTYVDGVHVKRTVTNKVWEWGQNSKSRVNVLFE